MGKGHSTPRVYCRIGDKWKYRFCVKRPVNDDMVEEVRGKVASYFERNAGDDRRKRGAADTSSKFEDLHFYLGHDGKEKLTSSLRVHARTTDAVDIKTAMQAAQAAARKQLGLGENTEEAA